MDQVSKEILFEKFEIIECFKKDAQAAVYLANHIYLGKKIILKSLNTKKIFEDSVVDRFKREAKLLAKLDHPSIIKVLDFGMYGDFFYISFEYFESRNLREFLKTNKLTIEQKEKLFVHILLGLRFAHSNKIIHRDIKPENVLVDDSLNLKISDFGLALIQDDAFETSKYSIVGTPCYMSPEQVNGSKLTMQSDLFSLGSLAYELFTEKNLFLGNDVAQTINNVINFNSSLVDPNVEHLPENIKSVIKKLLKKNLNERLKTVDEALAFFDVDLQDSNVGSANTNNAVNKNKTNTILYTSAAAIIALLIFISFNFTGKSNSAEEIPVDTKNSEVAQQPEETIQNKIDEQPAVDKVKTEPKTIDESTVENKTENKVDPSDNTPVVNEEEKQDVEIAYGKLSVECLPWAEVFINDKRIDTTPIDSLLTFTAGEYNLKLVHPDYPEYTGKFKIEKDKTTSIKILLDSLVGYLKCNVFPWGEIYVDNKFLGQTPLSNMEKLKKGEHTINIKNPSFPEYVGSFNINGQDTVEINFNFSDRKFSIANNK